VVEHHDGRLDAAGVRLLVKRDDLIHPDMPGNKWRKLKYNLVEAADKSHDTLLTFGGAYSNHIRATASAWHHFGFNTIGVIRGEEHTPLNPTLAHAVSRGMRLTYLDRETYRAKHSYHGGGYARTTPRLAAFGADFAARHGIALDRVYLAKMMLGIFALIESRTFAPGTTIVAVVTG